MGQITIQANNRTIVMKNKISVKFYVYIYPILLWISDDVNRIVIVLWWLLTDPEYLIWAINHEGTRCLDSRWQWFKQKTCKVDNYCEAISKLCDELKKRQEGD